MTSNDKDFEDGVARCFTAVMNTGGSYIRDKEKALFVSVKGNVTPMDLLASLKKELKSYKEFLPFSLDMDALEISYDIAIVQKIRLDELIEKEKALYEIKNKLALLE